MMRTSLTWKMLVSALIFGFLCPCLVVAQQADPKFPVLLSTGLPAADLPEDVLPSGAVAYLRANNVQTFLENFDSLVMTMVPEKALPPEMEPFLANPQPLISFFGAQAFGQQALTASNLSDLTGLALARPASVAVYPMPAGKGVIASLPVANATLMSGMVESLLAPESFEKGAIGNVSYYRVTLTNPKLPPELYILASEKTIFFCASLDIAQMLVNSANVGTLGKDPVFTPAIQKYADRDLMLILSPGMVKDQLPAFQKQFAQIITPMFLQIRAKLQEVPAADRLLLDSRLRVQFGIDGLDQLIDYAEAYSSGIYRVLFERLFVILTDLDGLALALNLEKEFQTAAFTVFSKGITPENFPKSLPVEDLKKALSAVPGEKNLLVGLGQMPQAQVSPLFTALLDAVEAELKAKNLPMDGFLAFKAFHVGRQPHTPLAAKTPWTLNTIAPLSAKIDFSQFATLEDLVRYVSDQFAASQIVMPVTLMPAVAAGLVEQFFADEAQRITNNGQAYNTLRTKLPFKQPFLDTSARFQQEDAGNGVKKLILEKIYTTRRGIFGYQQHALVNRRILFHQQKAGYDMLYTPGADAAMLKPFLDASSYPVSGATTALLDQAPAGTFTVSTFRVLQLIATLLDALTGIEDIVHRELDAFLTKAQEIVTTSGKDDMAAQLLTAKLAPPLSLLSLNLNAEGKVYAVLPGGLYYPRPVIMPKVKELFADFLPKASEVGGGASFVAVQPGTLEFSSVQNMAGLALLVKTVGNAFYETYMLTPDGQDLLFNTLKHPSDFQDLTGEEIFINPLWESFKAGEGAPWVAAAQRAKRLRTAADMRALATALGIYQVDQGTFPKYQEATDFWNLEFPAEYYEGTYTDAWEMPFVYLSDLEGQNYLLLSYGKDGMPGSMEGAFDADLIMLNGMFIAPDDLADGFMEADLNTALILAIQANAYNVVDALLQAGASPDAQDAQGKSALTLATELEYTDIVDLLTEAGAAQ